MAQLEELENDIRVYLELDSHHDFWQSLMIVCKDEVAQARKRAEQEKTRGSLCVCGCVLVCGEILKAHLLPVRVTTHGFTGLFVSIMKWIN